MELQNFTRRRGETVNELLTRFELVRDRAATDGNHTITREGFALAVVRAVGIHEDQQMLLLAPIQGRMPNNEQENRNFE